MRKATVPKSILLILTSICLLFLSAFLFLQDDEGATSSVTAGASHRRMLRSQRTFHHHHRKKIGNIAVDFYRTYDGTKRNFLGTKRHSISKWRTWLQLQGLNHWYAGRVRFVMGDIYSYNSSSMYETDNPCGAINQFAYSSGDVKHPDDRISIVYARRLGDSFAGCASGIGVPLGNAPAAIVGVSNDALPWPFLGIPAIGGATLAHEIGHLLGYQHTAWDTEGVYSYRSCELDVQYPRFSRVDLKDNQVVDVLRNVTYDYADWYGRSNVMAQFRLSSHGPEFYRIAMFKNGYASVFEEIARCWFNESAAAATCGRSNLDH